MSKLSEVSIAEEKDNNISEIINDDIIFQAIKHGLKSDDRSVKESRVGGDKAVPATEPNVEESRDGGDKPAEPSVEESRGGGDKAAEPSVKENRVGGDKAVPAAEPSVKESRVGGDKAVPAAEPNVEESRDGGDKAAEPSVEESRGGGDKAAEPSVEESRGGGDKAAEPSVEESRDGGDKAAESSVEESRGAGDKAAEPSVEESREGGDKAAEPSGFKHKTEHKIYPDLDTLLGFGKFQHFQIWVFQTIVAILGALSFLQLIYIVSDPPDWYCSLGEEKCPSTGDVCGGGIIQYNTSHENYLYSLPVQHNWICDQSLRGASVITATAVGSILNSIIFGQIVDKIGRRATVHITNIISMVFRLISFHVTDHYYLFLALTALGTNFFPVGVRAGYTLVTEFCNERGRKFAFISGWVWWVAAMSTFPFLAEYVKEWYTLGVSVTLVHLTVALMYPFVPESPRLLYCQKKYGRAAEILNTVRRVNGDEPIPEMEKFLEKMGEEENIETETLGVVSMFKERNLLRLLVCMATLYSVNDYFYFAGLLNAQNLAGNMFLNQALLALTELPSVFIGQYIIDRFGRRWSHVFCMVVATSK
ncbi:organic cation transporter 1 isoform X2 [Eurytemora carolleeae]|uniref:organic cation transporter 1 isoform X2 n=1 Tax=Eurytemora carolleeae TaxID=1294199 RepID=UPI000C78CE86|nr:organic cation transporter 1 isoform X2 [Eurytemora carolleeae]|eukprot:XP_023333212.1 organic cation transporter 1-like isoform X2 [Eurytemora affinis]